MGKLIDLTGQRFGLLTVIKRGTNRGGVVRWLCLCDCGAVTTVDSQKLRSGHTKSCGCLHGRGKGDVKTQPTWCEDLSGKRFGRLIVVSRAAPMPSGGVRFICRCDCGEEKIVSRQNLIRGRTVSCGCYNKEFLSNNTGDKNPSFKHGLTRKHRLWTIYHHMKGRCYRESNKSFKQYGGRGISICRIWRNDVKRFYQWAINSGYSDGLEIDRINNNGPYAPWNCQFITSRENKIKMHKQKNKYLPT